MNPSDCYYLGFISKTYGFQGDLVLILDVDNPEYYTKMESVFVQINGKLIPFFIEKFVLRPNSGHAVVHFQGIDDEDRARGLCGNDLFLPDSFLPLLGDNQFYYHEIKGFQVFDVIHGEIGVVEQVLDYPGNPVLQIKKHQKEVLVPLRDEFLESVDKARGRIFLKTPEGLIDLYLGEGNE